MLKFLSAATAVLATSIGAASAGDAYVAVSGGASFLNDSLNDGVLTSPFTTGAGTTIPGGTVIPSGTGVSWTTDFNTGWTVNGALGKRFGPFRGEVEVGYQDNNIARHSDVRIGGAPIGTEDAGVLVTGSGNLGVPVAALVDSAGGGARTIFVLANVYWDIDLGSKLKPYVGGGVGVGFVDVEYAPSAVTIIDDNSTEFAFSAAAGVSYALSAKTELYAGWRYRGTTDVSVDASLIPAAFDIENRAHVVEAGLRFYF